MKNIVIARKKYLFLITLTVIVAAAMLFGHWAINRMEGYVTRAGEANMTAVMEQMVQIYDIQAGQVYDQLHNIDSFLFHSPERSVITLDSKFCLNSVAGGREKQLLFVKDNGLVMSLDGKQHYIDVQASTLLMLQQKQRFVQSVTWSADMEKELRYLVALPCEPYFVDGERFTAIGMLYDRSSFDQLLDVSGYGGQAVLFAVDKTGIVTYTNQQDGKYDRNYSLLKHLKTEKDITEAQYENLKQQLDGRKSGVELIKADGTQYYFGYSPLGTSQSELVCIVPTEVLNSSLLEYQWLAMRMIFITVVIVAVLCLALILFISRAVSATQKARYEEENRRIREEAMAALQAEKDRADHANHAKSQFLSSMSHDIRTPMNAIIGFTALAATHLDDKELLKDYLGKISISSEHLLSLINDVLDMSRIESGNLKINEAECSVAVVAHDLRNILLSSVEAKRLDFFIDSIDVEHECVICDKLRVNQVLINIASNAIKYTPVGGRIEVRIAEIPTAPEGFADYEFSVKDNGIGMSAEYVKTIFQPFTRERSTTVSKIEGTGLGMAITKNIVDMMGGSIEVHSEPGQGSEFIVKLRFRTAENRTVITAIPALDGFRALVADDNMDSCSSVTKMLRTVGLRPEWTTSGREAVYRARMAKEENDPFRVYIIDWLMPDMNGVEVVRRIRGDIGGEVPIIILTAYDWGDIEKEAREAGVTAFCSKPLFLSELYEVLRTTGDTLPEQPEEKAPAEQFRGKRVLLADDVELNRIIAAALLQEAGIEVETAENGQGAVDKVAGSQPGYYDLVLMDLMMPVMDGFEATKEIRRLEGALADIPIIAMTANAFDDDRQAALQAGMDDFLAKPVEVEMLYDIMRKYLR
ncbi:MAG: response regulator [Oscillospiraceae bacterium]